MNYGFLKREKLNQKNPPCSGLLFYFEIVFSGSVSVSVSVAQSGFL